MANVSFALVLNVHQPCADYVVSLLEHDERTGRTEGLCVLGEEAEGGIGKAAMKSVFGNAETREPAQGGDCEGGEQK